MPFAMANKFCGAAHTLRIQ